MCPAHGVLRRGVADGAASATREGAHTCGCPPTTCGAGKRHQRLDRHDVAEGEREAPYIAADDEVHDGGTKVVVRMRRPIGSVRKIRVLIDAGAPSGSVVPCSSAAVYLVLILVRHADSMTRKGWGVASAAWSVIALLFLGATAWSVALGLVRLGLAGDEVQVRLSQCQFEGGGRGGGYVECSVRPVGDKSTDIEKVAYDGRSGEVVSAARTPWGLEVIDTSFTSWGTAVLYPLLPLGATALTAYLALRDARRARKPTLPNTPPPGQ